jgi:hypothetical protein
MADHTRLLLIGPASPLHAKVEAAVTAVGGRFTLSRVAAVSQAALLLEDVGAVIVDLSSPEAALVVDDLAELCEAVAHGGPAVVVVVPDALSPACAVAYGRLGDCVHGMLFGDQITPVEIVRVVRDALDRVAEAVVREQFLAGDFQRRVTEMLRDIRLELAAHSSRMARLEATDRQRDEAIREVMRTLHTVARRTKRVQQVVDGDVLKGRRPVAVRLDDLERANAEHEKDTEALKGTAKALALQLLPWLFSAVVAAGVAWLAAFVQQQDRPEHRDAPPPKAAARR